jgi:hypothetical protein
MARPKRDLRVVLIPSSSEHLMDVQVLGVNLPFPSVSGDAVGIYSS